MERKGLLEVRDLKEHFDTNRGLLQAMDSILFLIEKGKTLGVVGESGYGKFTLGRTIPRLREPTSGEIWLNGEDTIEYDEKQVKTLRPKMQVILQGLYFSLSPRMMVSQATEAPLVFQGTYRKNNREDLQKKVREMMDLVGLVCCFASFYLHKLGGGRRQRVGIARTPALNPEFVVYDELVSALNVPIQTQVLNPTRNLQGQMELTYPFVTHGLSVVKHLSGSTMVMYLEQLVERARSDELFEHPLHPYTRALLSVIPIPDPIIKMEREILNGESSSPINMGDGCRSVERYPKATPEYVRPTREVEASPGHFVLYHLLYKENQVGS